MSESNNYVDARTPEERANEPKSILTVSDPITSTTPDTEWEKEFIEKGADLEHARWAGWQKHFFGKCLIANSHNDTDFVNLVLKKEDYERWCRQIATPYSDLSEPEKESDRREVRTYLPLINNLLTSRDTYWKERVREAYKDKTNGL